MYTNQTAFTTSYMFLMQQGRPSHSGKYDCHYRHPTENLQCAVGCLIEDDEYRFSFEGRAVQSSHFSVRGLAEVDTNLLIRMQSAHDSAIHYGDFRTHIRKRYTDIAKEFNLILPEPQTTILISIAEQASSELSLV